MLDIIRTSKFKKDYKKIKNSGKNIELLKELMIKLIIQEPLEVKQKDHKLAGNYKGHRECHIEPDWLLIYCINYDKNEITFVRTGTHSELFN